VKRVTTGWTWMGKEMTENHHKKGGRATLEPPSPPRESMLQGRTDKRPVCGTNLKFRRRSNFGTSDKGNGTCTPRRERATGPSKPRCRNICFLENEKREKLRDDECFVLSLVVCFLYILSSHTCVFVGPPSCVLTGPSHKTYLYHVQLVSHELRRVGI